MNNANNGNNGNNDDFERNGSGSDPWDKGFGRPGEEEESEVPSDAPGQDGAPEDGTDSRPEESGQTGGESPTEDKGASQEPENPAPQQETQSPYGRQQNGIPYGPYGQYGGNNSYGNGQYGGQNGSPYGGYGQNEPNSQNSQNGQNGSNEQSGQYGQYGNPGGYGPYGGNPYDQGRQPYWEYQYGGQYQQPTGPVPPRPPRRMGTGLKVFLWVLGVLTVGLVAGFTMFGIRSVQNGSFSLRDIPSRPWGTSSSSDSASSLPSSSSPNLAGAVPGEGTNAGFSGITIAEKPAGPEMSVKNIYKKVIPSVVGVETTITSMQGGASGVGEGTGIIATSDGYILTNAHVVNYSRGNKVKVILHDNSEYQATVVGYDQTSDLAVLKIKASGLTPATFGSVDVMEVGDQVLAIGNPGGISFAGSLTVGYVSALDRSIEAHSDSGMTYIQTDAAINPGNSGGPLVNLYGQVIGINSNKIVATGYEGMGFSIPVSRASSIINDLISKGYVSGRSRLGITAGTVTDSDRELKNIPQGVVIIDVGADSDMKNSGVVPGDIITKADGKAMTGMDDLYSVLSAHKPGDRITMTIYSTTDSEKVGGKRAGTTSNITVKLLEDKGETQTK